MVTVLLLTWGHVTLDQTLFQHVVGADFSPMATVGV